MKDRIEKRLELKAPPARVWRALTDYREFGAWFRVKLDGPFVPGQPAEGQITHPGYEHVRWKAVVQKMEPERLFSFTWHPYAIDPAVDYSAETPTLVEFRLEPTADGTLLVLTESGFDKSTRRPPCRGLPHERRRLERADAEHHRPCHAARLRAVSRGAATTPPYSPRSATRRAWRWSRRWRPARPRSIAQLTGGSRITRQAITKHLRVLEGAGVVRSARSGRAEPVRARSRPAHRDAGVPGPGRRSSGTRCWRRLKSLVES